MISTVDMQYLVQPIYGAIVLDKRRCKRVDGNALVVAEGGVDFYIRKVSLELLGSASEDLVINLIHFLLQLIYRYLHDLNYRLFFSIEHA